MWETSKTKTVLLFPLSNVFGKFKAPLETTAMWSANTALQIMCNKENGKN